MHQVIPRQGLCLRTAAREASDQSPSSGPRPAQLSSTLKIHGCGNARAHCSRLCGPPEQTPTYTLGVRVSTYPCAGTGPRPRRPPHKHPMAHLFPRRVREPGVWERTPRGESPGPHLSGPHPPVCLSGPHGCSPPTARTVPPFAPPAPRARWGLALPPPLRRVSTFTSPVAARGDAQDASQLTGGINKQEQRGASPQTSATPHGLPHTARGGTECGEDPDRPDSI